LGKILHSSGICVALIVLVLDAMPNIDRRLIIVPIFSYQAAA
jgi:hypothetical protein